jgi:hypothetical protein
MTSETFSRIRSDQFLKYTDWCLEAVSCPTAAYWHKLSFGVAHFTSSHRQ